MAKAMSFSYASQDPEQFNFRVEFDPPNEYFSLCVEEIRVEDESDRALLLFRCLSPSKFEYAPFEESQFAALPEPPFTAVSVEKVSPAGDRVSVRRFSELSSFCAMRSAATRPKAVLAFKFAKES